MWRRGRFCRLVGFGLIPWTLSARISKVSDVLYKFFVDAGELFYPGSSVLQLSTTSML